MSLKAALRKQAADRNGPMQLVVVLNDPTMVAALPTAYCDSIFAQYGINKEHLVGEAPFHVVFVEEGVALCILSKADKSAKVTIHGVDLRPGEEKNIELVGSEVYQLWDTFRNKIEPKVLTYEQLTKNYASVHKRIVRPS
jgi:hypothetical protein